MEYINGSSGRAAFQRLCLPSFPNDVYVLRILNICAYLYQSIPWERKLICFHTHIIKLYMFLIYKFQEFEYIILFRKPDTLYEKYGHRA